MVEKKRFELLVGLVVAIIVLTAVLLRVTELELMAAMVVSGGISVFIFLRLLALIGYLEERNR